jgi:hypothetical protein
MQGYVCELIIVTYVFQKFQGPDYLWLIDLHFSGFFLGLHDVFLLELGTDLNLNV